ncbi:hypothetical protein BDV19DRAFT_333526 [Aspergillus venezuelensis]
MACFSHEDYKVAWISALPLEMAAAKLMLDQVYSPLPQLQTDHKTYTLGSLLVRQPLHQSQFDENARWQHQIGACLSEFRHYNAAIEHLNSALILESTWKAKRELATVYQKQSRLDDSIDLLRESEAHSIDSLVERNSRPRTYDFDDNEYSPQDLDRIRMDLGLLYVGTGDDSNAVYWLIAALGVLDYIYTPTVMFRIITVLIATQHSRHDTIMQLVRMVDDQPWPYGTASIFARVLLRNFEHWYTWNNAQLPLAYATSAKRCNGLSWLENWYQSAISESIDFGQEATVICFEGTPAHSYDRFLDKEHEAILIWKSIISKHRVPDSPNYEMFCRARNRAVAAYAYKLLVNALEETGDRQALIVQDLEDLCDSELQSLSPDNVLFDGQSAVFIGVWYKINGRKQDARKYFKPYILHAISWRDQKFNETETSMHVYRALGHLLAMAGEDEDAIALLQLVHTPFTVRDGTSASPEERMASPWPVLGTDAVWFYHICLYAWGNYVNCNVCRRCNADICTRMPRGSQERGSRQSCL